MAPAFRRESSRSCREARIRHSEAETDSARPLDAGRRLVGADEDAGVDGKIVADRISKTDIEGLLRLCAALRRYMHRVFEIDVERAEDHVVERGGILPADHIAAIRRVALLAERGLETEVETADE